MGEIGWHYDIDKNDYSSYNISYQEPIFPIFKVKSSSSSLIDDSIGFINKNYCLSDKGRKKGFYLRTLAENEKNYFVDFDGNIRVIGIDGRNRWFIIIISK